jgi:fructosamine-3-kinase
MPAETFYAGSSGLAPVNTAYPAILDELGLGEPVQLTPIGGGCIADAQVAAFADGTSVFVKCAAGTPGMFEREAQGLHALSAAAAIRIPEVLLVGSDALVLEMIHEAPRKPAFFESFGRDFAKLHHHRSPAFGFPHDNFIGSTPQQNTPMNGPWATVAGILPAAAPPVPGQFSGRARARPRRGTSSGSS